MDYLDSTDLRRLGFGREAAWRVMREIGPVHFGRRRVITSDDLEDWVRRQQLQQQQQAQT